VPALLTEAVVLTGAVAASEVGVVESVESQSVLAAASSEASMRAIAAMSPLLTADAEIDPETIEAGEQSNAAVTAAAIAPAVAECARY
jgi:hypothetical protein